MPEPTFDELIEAMKTGTGVLKDCEIPFVLGGGLAAWARGGPKTEHDVDFMLKQEDAEAALAAFEQAGYRTERPPEGWLYKTWIDDVLVDLIFHPAAGPITDEVERFRHRRGVQVTAPRTVVARGDDWWDAWTGFFF